MNYPIIALILLHTLGLGGIIAMHGEERTSYNFYSGFLGYAIELTLLYLAFN
jgi:hypothetical protein